MDSEKQAVLTNALILAHQSIGIDECKILVLVAKDAKGKISLIRSQPQNPDERVGGEAEIAQLLVDTLAAIARGPATSHREMLVSATGEREVVKER